jgi:plastocyanin
VQGDASGILGGPFGDPLDRLSRAGGAHQLLVVAVCCDQRQGFRRPVFLNPATSHGQSFQRSRVRLRHRWNLPAAWGGRKAGLALLLALVAWSWQAPRTVNAQRVHEIRLEGDPLTGVFRFVPSEVPARPGEVLRFVNQSGGPHSIGFRPDGLSAPAKAALNAAMPDRLGDLRGPLLLAQGARYEITIPPLPAGNYEFFCLPHLAYRMVGQLLIRGRSTP